MEIYILIILMLILAIFIVVLLSLNVASSIIKLDQSLGDTNEESLKIVKIFSKLPKKLENIEEKGSEFLQTIHMFETPMKQTKDYLQKAEVFRSQIRKLRDEKKALQREHESELRKRDHEHKKKIDAIHVEFQKQYAKLEEMYKESQQVSGGSHIQKYLEEERKKADHYAVIEIEKEQAKKAAEQQASMGITSFGGHTFGAQSIADGFEGVQEEEEDDKSPFSSHMAKHGFGLNEHDHLHETSTPSQIRELREGIIRTREGIDRELEEYND
ncbi:hypothetical protein ADUPG1_009182 [Aduncisulcus paluster]|uniref:Uncharacterized protein n=1 Tax=Aduncisulcus paluster TaxID=2918883 RepID=A0ABQ5KXK7_9EUKA|nr:hypothetical protein ADUPG1_009182 [Aduncisulcus paluster]|eukprot:gnl/Carplike_NY0171/4256_a5760_340.p1 GENE.gnl/Carplike_NY0171/4256_a5760_340~~gnl/Carplike_NY0171/4256_a5760_340.p1  ORF type:complete len:271 (-),score=79.65 gnl/Carplike_NY0171/4256_a5760_340:117-929(-)